MSKIPRPLSKSDHILLKEYLSTIELSPNNTPRLFAIGFLGLPGTGKSTIADAIGSNLGIPVNRSDQIRRFLNQKGFPGESPRQEIMAALAEERTLYFYKNKTSAVIDANFTEYAANSRSNAQRHGASLLLVRTICPDDVAIERLKSRHESKTSGNSLVTEDHFEEIKSRIATFESVDDPYFVIDTTTETTPQLKRLYIKMKQDGFIFR